MVVEAVVRFKGQLQLGRMQCTWESLPYDVAVTFKKEAQEHALSNAFRS